MDHFSKYAKTYIIDNKDTDTIINKLKKFIKEIGKPELIHTDNGGEFTSNKFKLFCIDNNIKIINGCPRHPQSQGAVESFNKYIISKLQCFKLEEKKNFNINKDIDNDIKIYNNNMHSITRIEPILALKMKNKRQLQKVLENTIKSQINKNKECAIIEKGSKALLCRNFVKNGKYLNEKKFLKKIYDIPVIIEESNGGNKCKIKVNKNIKNLKVNTLYDCNYKLIKFCSDEVWEKINSI